MSGTSTSYFENYRLDPELKKSVGKIVLTQQDTTNNDFLNKESTKFNMHTKTLIEGYLDPNQKNEAGIGIEDFNDKMVLRFKNEHELSLYFDAVDQLSNVVILKGQNVLLEKEHYKDILKSFVNLNKDFLLYLCKDGQYGDVKNFMEGNDTEREQDEGEYDGCFTNE